LLSLHLPKPVPHLISWIGCPNRHGLHSHVGQPFLSVTKPFGHGPAHLTSGQGRGIATTSSIDVGELKVCTKRMVPKTSKPKIDGCCIMLDGLKV
jgi:hypothetical protein